MEKHLKYVVVHLSWVDYNDIKIIDIISVSYFETEKYYKSSSNLVFALVAQTFLSVNLCRKMAL